MRTVLAIGTAGALAALLTACGAIDESADTQPTATLSLVTETPIPTVGTTATNEPEPTSLAVAGPVVEVTIDGDTVIPKGDRIDAKVGQPVTFIVTSDRAGGLHVHSSPEQSPEFEKGTTTIEVTVDKPGIVEVEEHESDALIVQLEVR